MVHDLPLDISRYIHRNLDKDFDISTRYTLGPRYNLNLWYIPVDNLHTGCLSNRVNMCKSQHRSIRDRLHYNHKATEYKA